MGERTEIAWCDSTFNPWIGCQKVSAGCDNCYAEALMDKRFGRVEWGPHGERKRTSAANWQQPVGWNARARGFHLNFGRRRRVFCSSLADVFDNKAPEGARSDLFDLIAATPNLDWLLLTKRPENFARFFPTGKWPNIWLGVTAEDQAAYDRRWPLLCEQRGVAVKFISYEPAVGPLTIMNHKERPDWLICGGESGRGFRDVPLFTWAGDLIDECDQGYVPFFFKQMPGLRPIPEELMIRQFPSGARA